MGNGFDQITEKIYLGDYTSANNIPELKEEGITKILTVMDYDDGQNEKYDPNEFTHLKFNVCDDEYQNIIQYFGECLNYIKEKDEKVLVHCMAGASRSATIVIAYLMWKEKKSVHDELNFVNSKRFIFPNPGFLSQLKTFEKLLIENDYDINKINFEQIKWEPGFNN